MTDVCLCEYTSHGHCGIVDGESIINGRTVELLARVAGHQVGAVNRAGGRRGRGGGRARLPPRIRPSGA